MPKTIWLINEYASTPETGMGGRHYYLARELEALGYTVYVIAASYTHLLREPPVVDRLFQLERREGINVVWVKVPHYKHALSKLRIINWFLLSFRLIKLHRAIPGKPDVVLYSSPSLIGYLGAERLARKLQVPLAFEVRDIWPLTFCDVGGYSPKQPFIRFLQWIEDRAYRNADIVISNLKNAHEHMVKHGLNVNKFHWIPNGISATESGSSESLEERYASQLPASGFIVGYTGTLGLANCLQNLIKTAEIVKDTSEIKFVLVGNGREKTYLQNEVRQAQLSNVTFVDAVPKSQVQAMLQKFDGLYMGLSKSDLFRFGVSPNKLFDYLYAGKPILYAIDSGNYRPVDEALAGYGVPPEDPRALADAVLKLYKMSAEKRNELGRNGYEAAIKQYEYSALARELAKTLFPDEQKI